MNPNPIPSSLLINLPPSICLQHNLPYQLLYCSHQRCNNNIRLCFQCRQHHKDHLKYLTERKVVSEDIAKGLKKCFSKIQQFQKRSRELQKLINYAKNKSREEYENIQCNMIQEMKYDKANLQKKLQRMQEIYSILNQKQRLQTYFARLTNLNLLPIKVKLSNQLGIRNFKEKNQRLCYLLHKSTYEQHQRLYDQFFQLKKQFQFFLQNNTTFKIGQIIAMKNSQRQKIENNNKNALKVKNNGKQNNLQGQKQHQQQKQKPKTTLNFGQGIINGILTFLNI